MLFGKDIIYLSNLDSTNNFAAKMFSDNLCQNGSVIMSDRQSNGKGQRGSIWESENGKNLLCTFVYQPDNLSVDKQAQINWATSLSVKACLHTIENRLPERPAMMKLRTLIRPRRVAMRIDMHHPDRL